MKTRSLLLTALAAVVLAALLAWILRPTVLEVETAPVIAGSLLQTVDEDGVLRVRDRYRLTAPVSGLLQRPQVKVGDSVSKGQVLAVIEPANAQLLDARTRTELLARREAADARHARSATLLRQANEALRQAERDAGRIDDLARQGFLAASDKEKTALALAARRREQEAATFELDAALHDLQQARAAAGRSGTDTSARQGQWALRAPVNGTVLSLALESAGPLALGATILEVGDLSGLEAAIDVLSEDATRIANGATVTLAAGDATRLSGRVSRVEPAAHTKVSALGIEEQRVNVIVDLDGSSAQAARAVGDGYRVEAHIDVARREAALQVPVAALLRQSGRWAVYVEEGGRARLRAVEIGLRNSSSAEVLSGLKAGQPVVLYPGDALRDGSRIATRPQSR